MCVLAAAMAVTPYQVAFPAPWQVEQASADTAACPAADSCGVVVILNPPVDVEVGLWQLSQPAPPIGMWLAAPDVPTVPGGPLAIVPSHWTSPGVPALE